MYCLPPTVRWCVLQMRALGVCCLCILPGLYCWQSYTPVGSTACWGCTAGSTAGRELCGDRDRRGAQGGSYGGYATLAGLTFTPELYCCGVDIVGPSHIRTLLQSIPPYWYTPHPPAIHPSLLHHIADFRKRFLRRV